MKTIYMTEDGKKFESKEEVKQQVRLMKLRKH